MKRTLAMILAVCLIMSFLSLTAFAEEDQLTVGTPVTVTGTKTYTFVAPETGTYIIQGADGGFIDLYFGEINVSWGSKVVFDAEKDGVYDVLLESMGASEVFTVEKAAEATAVTLGTDEWTGYVDSYHEFELICIPENSYTTIASVSSDNEAVVAVGHYNQYVTVELLAVGTANVTVTTVNGKSATVKVNVKNHETIAVGETKDVTIGENKEMVFSFTPTENGIYAFKYEGYVSGISIDLNVAYEYVDEGVTFKGVTGAPVVIKVYSHNGDSFQVSLVEGNHPEQIALKDDCLDVIFVGQSTWYEVVTDTENAYIGQAEWKTSDSALVKIDAYGKEANLKGVKAGTFTLTVTTENGKTATKTITVKEPIVIKSGEEKVAKYPTLYAFTPTETAKYAVYAEDWMNLMDQNGYHIEGELLTSVSYGSAHAYELTKGETYLIEVEGLEDGETVGVKKYVADKNLAIKGSKSVMVGLPVMLEISSKGLISTRELGKWTWKVSDTSVARIDEAADSACMIDTLKSGKVTITATSETGKTLTHTLEIMSLAEFVEELYSQHKVTAGGNKVMVENAIQDHSITIVGDIDDLDQVFIIPNAGDTLDDDEVINEDNLIVIPREKLNAKAGSGKVTVTIPAATIQQLGVGKHKVMISMMAKMGDGGAMTNLTVKAVDTTNPPAGDSFQLTGALTAMVCAVLGMGVCIISFRKKKI